jgi:hypothetical protein
MSIKALAECAFVGEAEILTNTFFDSVCQVKYRSIEVGDFPALLFHSQDVRDGDFLSFHEKTSILGNIFSRIPNAMS